MSVHIGKQIKARLEALSISKSELARRISTTPQNVFGIFKRQSIDTEMLQKICVALDYDFFQYYVANPNVNIANEPSVPYNTKTKIELAKCEEALKQAIQENAYLKEINQLLKDKRE